MAQFTQEVNCGKVSCRTLMFAILCHFGMWMMQKMIICGVGWKDYSPARSHALQRVAVDGVTVHVWGMRWGA
jgi:hypothetical protein